MRGNLTGSVVASIMARSIPACAGEPDAANEADGQPAVYPRVCGGTFTGGSGFTVAPGLSPRVRGNPCPKAPGWIRGGSIPACAGEPAPSQAPWPPRTVYPRVCGGTIIGLGDIDYVKGLSPRVRGNL